MLISIRVCLKIIFNFGDDMKKIQVGQIAPDLNLQTVDEAPIQLSEAWSGGRNALVIFLRHLA